MRLLKPVLFLIVQSIYNCSEACEACEKQQPKITKGLTHGIGPDSNWDWVIILIVTLITLLTFYLSLKFILFPGEKDENHIKKSILRNL